MKQYTSKATKGEIMSLIIEHFQKVSTDYAQSLQNGNNELLQERNFGRYIAMIELLNCIKIFENETP